MVATPTLAASPAKVFHAALNKGPTIRSLVVYIASASLLTLVHVLTALVLEVNAGNDPRLGLFVKSRYAVRAQPPPAGQLIVSRKHPYYLNGRLLYLALSQISLASFYALRNFMMDRVAVKWTGLLSVASADFLRFSSFAHLKTERSKPRPIFHACSYRHSSPQCLLYHRHWFRNSCSTLRNRKGGTHPSGLTAPDCIALPASIPRALSSRLVLIDPSCEAFWPSVPRLFPGV